MKKETTVWYQTRPAHIVMAVVAVGVSYLFASLAIHTGSLIQYTIAVLALLWAVRSAFKAVKKS